MRAFLLYIDDWLASKKIERMDAFEERGYLRLLLRAATEHDCGLPDNDAELAIYSKLGEQWWKQSKEKAFRLDGKTSGEKLRECFFLRDGRLYNERLLKEFEYQQSTAVKRSKAAVIANEARWSRDRKPKSESDPNQIRIGPKSDSQTDPNDVCVYVSSSQKEVSEKKEATEFDFEAGFHEIWQLYPKKGRTKIIDSQRMYCECIAPDPFRIHESLASPLRPGGKWAASRNWKQGFVSALSEYIRNRRDLEEPEPYDQAKEANRNGKVSTLEAARKSIEEVNLADVETAY